MAWIALFLASRVGAFGSVGRREAWRRVERTIGLALLAHFVIQPQFRSRIWNQRVFPVRRDLQSEPGNDPATLWFPSGFAGVSGGVILLIALIICAAGWWGRPRYAPLRAPVRGIALMVTAVGIAFTIAGFAGLAREGRLGFFEPQFGQPQVTSWVVFAGEIPLAALSVLACAGLAAAWLSGALALSKAPPVEAPVNRSHRRGQRGGRRLGRQACRGDLGQQ